MKKRYNIEQRVSGLFINKNKKGFVLIEYKEKVKNGFFVKKIKKTRIKNKV